MPVTHFYHLVVEVTEIGWRESGRPGGKVCWCLRTKHPVASGLKRYELLATLNCIKDGQSNLKMTAHVLARDRVNRNAPKGLLRVGAEHPAVELDDAVQVAQQPEIVLGRVFRRGLVEPAESVDKALFVVAHCVYARTTQVLVTTGSQVAIRPASTTFHQVLEYEGYVLVVDEARGKAERLHGRVELDLHAFLDSDVTDDAGWSKVDGVFPSGKTRSKLGGVEETGAGRRKKQATAASEPSRCQRRFGSLGLLPRHGNL
jgi:hypothetical protein